MHAAQGVCIPVHDGAINKQQLHLLVDDTPQGSPSHVMRFVCVQALLWIRGQQVWC